MSFEETTFIIVPFIEDEDVMHFEKFISLRLFILRSWNVTGRTSPAKLSSPKEATLDGSEVFVLEEYKAKAKGKSIEASLSFTPPATFM